MRGTAREAREYMRERVGMNNSGKDANAREANDARMGRDKDGKRRTDSPRIVAVTSPTS
jgi:hypothetical protein